MNKRPDETIASLREIGCKVSVRQKRPLKNTSPLRHDPLNPFFSRHELLEGEEFSLNGGLTTVNITTPTGVNFEGISECSEKDPFNKRIGLQIALGRAYKNIINSY